MMDTNETMMRLASAHQRIVDGVNLPADWAIRRALLETGRPYDEPTVQMVKGVQLKNNTTLMVLARFIQKHEPVTDLIKEAARFVVTQTTAKYRREDVMDGGCDSSIEVEVATKAIIHGIEMGKSGEF